MVQTGQEESLLSPIEIAESEYKSEAESSTESVLSAQRSQATPPSLTLLSLSLSLPPPYTMSQPNYLAIIRQLQEQIAVLLAQIEEKEVGEGSGVGTANMDVTKP